MANLHETTLEAAFHDDELEETFASKPRCITFLCFRCQLGNPRRSGYRSLVHEDANDEKWWKQRSQRAKEQFSESVARLRWRKAAAADGEHLKRRKVVYSYSFRSYALNFDEGKDLAAERDEISIQVLGVN